MSESPTDNPEPLNFSDEEILALRKFGRDSRVRPSSSHPVAEPEEAVEAEPSIGLAGQN